MRITVASGNIAVLLALGCDSQTMPPATSGHLPEEPGTSVQVALDSAASASLALALEHDDTLDAATLLRDHAVPFTAELGYDPLSAPQLDHIVEVLSGPASGADAILNTVGRTGLALIDENPYPSFPYGYMNIYAAHLPVFVSADMVLEALHRSYDDILVALEREVLKPRLKRLLDGMNDRLSNGALADDADLADDVRFYLNVGRALLEPKLARGLGPELRRFVDAAEAAAGEQQLSLFGVPRAIDFSQFTPRGHYAGDEALERYFRAMIWFGRTDLRLIETAADGATVFRRRQLDVAYALRELLGADGIEEWRRLDQAIGAFAGEHDDMTPSELDELAASLGVSDRQGLAALDDAAIAQAIVDGKYGAQRIASQVMRRSGAGPATLPLSASFYLLGQRYTVDSHVLSSVVYDRAPDRVVPDPLDVAFGALGNDQAASLLAPQLEAHTYAPQLGRVRSVVDAHPEEYWSGSLYTAWLSALRELSPSAAAFEAQPGLPSIARSEGWGRRLLNTQLGSWSQLRRDSVLYVKQSYTSNVACEFPDAYVDPYPRFFERLVTLAERGTQLVSELDWGQSGLGARVASYFGELQRISTILGEMASAELSGTPFSEEQLAFVNDAVSVDANCDGTIFGQRGWYEELFFDPLRAVELDPTIADVHTDIGGDLPLQRPPSVLHVGTGMPRAMVVTVNSCNGPRAYAGIVYTYRELLIQSLTRLTDDDWKARLGTPSEPGDPSWLQPVVAR